MEDFVMPVVPLSARGSKLPTCMGAVGIKIHVLLWFVDADVYNKTKR